MTQDQHIKANPLGAVVDISIGLMVVVLAHLVLVSSDKAAWFASRMSQIPAEKQPGMGTMVMNIITAIPPFAAPYIASSGCVVAIASCNAKLGWHPFPYSRTGTVGRAFLVSLLTASVLTCASDLLAGIHERVTGMGEYDYDGGGRVAVFCMFLTAAASFLVSSGLVLDLTRRGEVAAKEIFGHDVFPAQAVRMQTWTSVLMVGVLSLVAALTWVLAYFPARAPKDMAPSLLAAGLPPLHVPFSWVGDLLGFGRMQACGLSVIICACIVWFAAKVAMPSITAVRTPEPSAVEA